VDLIAYENRLKMAIAEYKERLDVSVWRRLSQEERDKWEAFVDVVFIYSRLLTFF